MTVTVFTCSECGAAVYRDTSSKWLPLPVKNADDDEPHSCDDFAPVVRDPAAWAAVAAEGRRFA